MFQALELLTPETPLKVVFERNSGFNDTPLNSPKPIVDLFVNEERKRKTKSNFTGIPLPKFKQIVPVVANKPKNLPFPVTRRSERLSDKTPINYI